MNKLTAEKCRQQIEEFQHLVDSESISTKAERHLQAYRIALPILEQQEKGNDGWIEWCGGECPVEKESHVEVKFRNGNTNSKYRAKVWGWGSSPEMPMDYDIIAYRVIK